MLECKIFLFHYRYDITEMIFNQKHQRVNPQARATSGNTAQRTSPTVTRQWHVGNRHRSRRSDLEKQTNQCDFQNPVGPEARLPSVQGESSLLGEYPGPPLLTHQAGKPKCLNKYDPRGRGLGRGRAKVSTERKQGPPAVSPFLGFSWNRPPREINLRETDGGNNHKLDSLQEAESRCGAVKYSSSDDSSNSDIDIDARQSSRRGSTGHRRRAPCQAGVLSSAEKLETASPSFSLKNTNVEQTETSLVDNMQVLKSPYKDELNWSNTSLEQRDSDVIVESSEEEVESDSS